MKLYYAYGDITINHNSSNIQFPTVYDKIFCERRDKLENTEKNPL